MDDLISRQAAIDVVNKLVEWYKEKWHESRPTSESVIDVLNDLPSAQPQWIPCSERLPEAEYGESDNVLTTCIYKDAVDGYRSVKTLYYNGGVWCYPTGETFEGKVLAWMPLPKPYGGESE